MTGRTPTLVVDRRPIRWGQRAPLLGLLLTLVGSLAAEETDPPPSLLSVQVDAEAIVNQSIYSGSSKACAPAALANSLRQGTPSMKRVWEDFVGADEANQLRYLVDRWFLTPPSKVYPRKKRFSFDGVLEEDLAAAASELLVEHELSPLTAGYLDREPGETSAAFLARIHEKIALSLKRGTPPMLSLKTYVARRFEKRNNQIDWEPSNHHWVVVTGITPSLRNTDLGFTLDLIDPNGGRRTSAFVFAETRLDFWALKGDLGRGQWLTGRPFLLVQAPGVISLRPKEADWTDRIIVVANYLIGDYGKGF